MNTFPSPSTADEPNPPRITWGAFSSRKKKQVEIDSSPAPQPRQLLQDWLADPPQIYTPENDPSTKPKPPRNLFADLVQKIYGTYSPSKSDQNHATPQTPDSTPVLASTASDSAGHDPKP